MPKKRFIAEQIVLMLREAEIQIAKGLNLDQVCRNLGFSTHSYYRWRKEYGGMNYLTGRSLKLYLKQKCLWSAGRQNIIQSGRRVH